MTEDPHPHRHRGRRILRPILRRLLRLATGALALAGIALLLVGAVAFVVYLNRARVVNQVLEYIVAPYEVSVDDIDFFPIGEVHVDNLRLTPKGSTSKQPLAAIPEVDITYEFTEIRRTGKLKTVILRRPSFHLDDAHLQAFARRRERTKQNQGGTFTLSRLDIFTDTFHVEEGTFELALDGLPPASARWHFHSGPFRFDETGRAVETFRFDLSEIEIGKGDDPSRIDTLSASAHVARDLSRVDVEAIDADGVKLRITPAWFGGSTPPPDSPSTAKTKPKRDATGSNDPPDPVDFHFHSVDLGRASVGLTGFDGRNGGVALPDITFETTSEFENLHFVDGRFDSERPLSLVAEPFHFGRGDTPFLSADRVGLHIDSLGDLVHGQRIADIAIHGPDMVLSDETLSAFQSASSEKTEENLPDDDPAPDESTPSPSATEPRPWIIAHGTVEDGHFLQRDATYGDTPAPRLETRVEGELEDLRFGGPHGFASDGRQSVQLEQARLHAPGASASNAPLIALERAKLAGPWSDFADDRLVERLRVRKPHITFTDEALGDWLEPAIASGEKGGDDTGDAPPVYKIEHLDVTGGTLDADSTFAGGRVPRILSDFSLSTDAEAEEPFAYRASLEDFRLRNRPTRGGSPHPEADEANADIPNVDPVAKEEVFTVREITVQATAAELQRARRIASVRLSGAQLGVGKGLQTVVDALTRAENDEAEQPKDEGDSSPSTPPPDPDPDSDPPSPPANDTVPDTDERTDPEPDSNAGAEARAEAETESSLPGWTIEKLEVTRSRVRFQSLIPQIEGLDFAVETTLHDVPLSPDALLAQDEIQKVELAGLEIKDPYDSFITVAFLPTIFVEFSLAGLARQEIEKIDLIAPSLHVGQGLFWWIEYQRKFREQNEGSSVGLEGGGPVTSTPDWTIERVDATAGKIVIAPTGIPIGIVPFPFNASTTMEDGRIELKLNIPEEQKVYRFPDYDVNLYGLGGDVQFNVPIEQVDNNLVQTFSLDRAVWKDYEAEDLYLSVTFDAEGVYGEFGGEAYGGYAEGGFNYYLNQSGNWDAWVAGTDMNTGPITDVLVPENFQMEGKVSLELVTEGTGGQLGETTGDFQTLTPGWFDITQFDEILERLPDDWSNLQRSLTELGLVALRRFSYDKGSGSLYLQGRDGELQLRFTGPHGVRNLNLHLHDERNTTAAAGEDEPRPTASARPVNDAP